MIRKYEEFIYENSKGIFDILPIEEVEDQFLRIREVFGCEVLVEMKKCGSHSFNGLLKKDAYNIIVREGGLNNKPELAKKVYGEFDQIKRRMKSMYPELNIDIHKADNTYFSGVIISKKG